MTWTEERPTMERPDGGASEPGLVRVAVPIYGLGFGGCGARQLERLVRQEPGVRGVYVNPATETAYVTYDPARVERGGLSRAFAAAGYRTGTPEVWPRRPR